MTEDTTQRIVQTLTALQKEFPLMRFGQLVLTVAQSARGPVIDAAYEVTDEEFLEAARRLLERRREQNPAASSSSQVKRAV